MLRWSYKPRAPDGRQYVWERADGIRVRRSEKGRGAFISMPKADGTYEQAPGKYSGPEVAMNYVDRTYPDIYKPVATA